MQPSTIIRPAPTYKQPEPSFLLPSQTVKEEFSEFRRKISEVHSEDKIEKLEFVLDYADLNFRQELNESFSLDLRLESEIEEEEKEEAEEFQHEKDVQGGQVGSDIKVESSDSVSLVS